MLHPASVHFAIVLPLVAAGFSVAYLMNRTEGMSKISTRLTVIAAIAMIGVWYTGSQAGPQIYDYLSEAGKHELIEHKTLGLYLAIAMSIIAVLKFIGCKAKKFALEVLAIILLFVATGVTFLQGKHGGEIVYNYGMPFKAYMIQDSLKEAAASAAKTDEDDAKVEIYEDAIDDINMISQDVNKLYGPTEKESE
jgi:uncharacterized membrane protein